MSLLKAFKFTLILAGVAGYWQAVSVAQSNSDDLLANLSPVSDAMLASPSANDWLMWRRSGAAVQVYALD